MHNYISNHFIKGSYYIQLISRHRTTLLTASAAIKKICNTRKAHDTYKMKR